MSPPGRHIRWIEKLHTDFDTILKAGKEKIKIRCCCEARQGENLTPILFSTVTQSLAKDTTKKIKREVLKINQIKHRNDGINIF